MSGNRFCRTPSILLAILLLLLLECCCIRATNITTIETPSNNADQRALDDNQEVDLSQSLRLKDTLNIFDIQHLAANWRTLRSEVGANCSRDLRTYFEGLKRGALWAAKSKYQTEFFGQCSMNSMKGNRLIEINCR